MFRVFVKQKSGREKMLSRELVDWLDCFKDRPWREGMRGKEVTELWLAQQLRTYGVRPRNMRVGEKVGKGYFWEELLEVFRRYIPRSEVEEWRKEAEMRKAESQNPKPEILNPKPSGE